MDEQEKPVPGDARQLAVTKVVTLRDLEQTSTSQSSSTEWVKCFRVNGSLQEWTMDDWEIANHLLLHIDVLNLQLYHLPLLITPVHCVYLVTFDLREGQKALQKIHKALKHIFAYASHNPDSLLNNCSPPTVLLVGTHQEACSDEKISAFAQELRKSLGERYRGLIRKPDDVFWAVEGDDVDIQNSDIFEEIKSHHCRPTVPTCQWIEHGHDLCTKFRSKAVVKLRDVMSCVSGTDVKRFLAFLHDYGFIVYSQYKELEEEDASFLLQPQYLCKLFAKVQDLTDSQKRNKVTIETLFNSDPELERGVKKWFEMFCIHMGLVIEEPVGDGRDLVFALNRRLQSEAASLAPCLYSVDALLVMFNVTDVEDDFFMPSRFFPAFASAFLKFLPELDKKRNLTVRIDQAYIRVDWKVGCHIHVTERESCIEIGFQLDAVNSDSEEQRKGKAKKLQMRCKSVQKLVERSVAHAVKNLKLLRGGECVRYGFYHLCGDTKIFAEYVSDEDDATLECCCSCSETPCTPMQEIWFKDVVNDKVYLQPQSVTGSVKDILKLVPGHSDDAARTATPSHIPDQEGPMSKWNFDALVSLQGDLKLRVLMNTGLIDRLQPAAGGFMSPGEEQRVKNQHGNDEQMGELIAILKGKRNKDFDTFLTMLRAVNYEAWADELMKEAEKFRRESVP